MGLPSKVHSCLFLSRQGVMLLVTGTFITHIISGELV